MAALLWWIGPYKRTFYRVNQLIWLLTLFVFCLPLQAKAQGSESKRLIYKDFYLQDEQVCRSCRGEWINPKQIELIPEPEKTRVPHVQVEIMDGKPDGKVYPADLCEMLSNWSLRILAGWVPSAL